MKTKTMCSQEKWIDYFETIGGVPDVYVTVWDCTAKIMAGGVDITDILPHGGDMAIQAVKKAGGAINISGMYPPTNRILLWLKKYAEKIAAEIEEAQRKEQEKEDTANLQAWQEYEKELCDFFSTIVYTEPADMARSQILNDQRAQRLFSEVKEAISRGCSSTDGATTASSYEEYIERIYSIGFYGPRQPFPQSLEEISMQAADVFGHLSGPFYRWTHGDDGYQNRGIDIALQEKYQTFFSSHPECGVMIRAKENTEGEKSYTVLRTNIYYQYATWGRWLKKLKKLDSALVFQGNVISLNY